MKTIKKGQEFKCVKDFLMQSGEIRFKAGKIYKSDGDGWLTDETENITNHMPLNDKFYEHFELVESRVKITWLDEINPKTTKTEIEIPAGCKIAKTEIIDGKLIVTYERDLPKSYYDIPNRNYITGFKSTSKKRAEAILALGQLIELAAYVGCEKFDFGFHELPPEFYKKYADLFEKAKNIKLS